MAVFRVFIAADHEKKKHRPHISFFTLPPPIHFKRTRPKVTSSRIEDRLQITCNCKKIIPLFPSNNSLFVYSDHNLIRGRK